MPDIYPRRNLPGDADVWGRTVEVRQDSTEMSVEMLQQSVQGQNRNTASSLQVLAGQIKAVQDAQAAIIVTQAQIQAAQADIVATTNFLSTQTVASSKSTLSQYTGTTSSLVWESFDGTYDAAVSVTTGGAGQLLIQGSATLLSSNTTSILGIEVVGQIGPSYPGPYSTYVSTLSAASSGVTRAVVFTGSANTTYTVRLRRGRDGSGTGAAMWRDQTLVVTRS